MTDVFKYVTLGLAGATMLFLALIIARDIGFVITVLMIALME